jgi:predicted dinucleotide-binding enzyme
MAVSGDHERSKAAVTDLFDATGFFVIDLGGLVAAGRIQQFGGRLAGHDPVRRAT